MNARLIVCVLALCALTSHLAEGVYFCSNDDHACAGEGAICGENGKCQCTNGYAGVPNLGCVPSNFGFCTLINDPRGKTLGGEPHKNGIDLPQPCEHLLAHYRINNAVDGSNCEVKVSVMESRFKGKYYVSDAQVELKYKVGAATKTFDLHARTESTLRVYDVTLRSSVNKGASWVSGSAASNQMSNVLTAHLGGTNSFFWSAYEERLSISVPSCGLKLFLRPGDSALKVNDQTIMPGLLVAVDQTSFDVDYLSLDKAFCLTPNKDTFDVADVTEPLHLNNDQAFLYRSIVANVPQVIPGVASGACTQMSQVLSSCPTDHKSQLAMEMCSFIFLEPLFSGCYGQAENSYDIVQLFTKCIAGFCNDDSASCGEAQDRITQRSCWDPAYSGFAGFNCNSL